jgi:hypothetical protein
MHEMIRAKDKLPPLLLLPEIIFFLVVVSIQAELKII